MSYSRRKKHIPYQEALLFQDLVFEKADAEKNENNSRKRLVVTERRDFCATPHFARDGPSSDKLRKLFDDL